jgi:hypothetical protein
VSDSGWTVTIEAAGKPGDVDGDRLERFAAALEPLGGTASLAQNGSRYGATFSLYNVFPDDAETAVAKGCEIFRNAASDQADLPECPIVHAEAMTFEEHDANLELPAIPKLVGVSEIADILAVTRQRAHQLTKRSDFPAPVEQLAAGPVWTRQSLEHFIEEWHSDTPSEYQHDLVMLDRMLVLTRDLRALLAHSDVPPELHEKLRAMLDGWVQGTAPTVSALSRAYAQGAVTSSTYEALNRSIAGVLSAEPNDVPLPEHSAVPR